VSALAAFRRFILSQRGLLGRADAQAQEQLTAMARMISSSPALLARERQILDGYTASLAALLTEETGTPADEIEPWVAANAMMGIHRSLILDTRRRVLAGEPQTRLARAVRSRAERAFALVEGGLGDYAVKGS
jgi:hypothetical protein